MSMRDQIPYINPTKILEFFNNFPIWQFEAANPKQGESVKVVSATLEDYFRTIPISYRNDPRYAMEYVTGLLKMTQLLVNEGLLTPEGNASGFYQRYRGNGFSDASLIDYGYYDFMIYGFTSIRNNFKDTVRPIIINQNVKDKSEDIGTGFTLVYNNILYFVTARHCLPRHELIKIPQFVPQTPLKPVRIFAPDDGNIDLAIIEVPKKGGMISDKWFILDKPYVLDQVLTMGYPTINGFTEAVQISETSTIATDLKSTTGQITGQGQHYFGGLKDHFLVSSRVKGGNSGGPVINRYGQIVGVVIEILEYEGKPDLLGYGVAISSVVLEDLLQAVQGVNSKIKFIELPFSLEENGFRVH